MCRLNFAKRGSWAASCRELTRADLERTCLPPPRGYQDCSVDLHSAICESPYASDTAEVGRVMLVTHRVLLAAAELLYKATQQAFKRTAF